MEATSHPETLVGADRPFFTTSENLDDIQSLSSVSFACGDLSIGRYRIHVMAIGGQAGPAMAAPIVGDNAITVREEEHHLRVPIIGRQRPAVAEHDGAAPCPSPCRKSRRRL